MDAKTENLLMWVAVIGGGYLLVKAVGGGLSDLGVGTPPAVAAQQATPGASNPFSPLFQPYLDNYYNGGPSTLCTEYGGAAGLKAIYTATGGQLNGTQSDLMVYAEEIYSAFGYIFHDDNTAVSVFNQLQDQCSVAFIADYLSCVYQKDLLTITTNGAWEVASWWTSGLTNAELNGVIAKINALPVYVAIPAPATAAAAAGSSGGSVPWYTQLGLMGM